MFIFETNDVGTAIFAKGQKLELDIDLWHKRFGHVNFPRLQEIQTKNVFFVLPKVPSLRSLPAREATPTSIPQRAQ